MLRIIPKQANQQYSCFIRQISSDSAKSTRRFIQTAPLTNNEVSYIPYKLQNQQQTQKVSTSSTNSTNHTNSTSETPAGWERHSLGARSFKDILKKNNNQQQPNSTAQQSSQSKPKEQKLTEQEPQPKNEQTSTIQKTTSTQQQAPNVQPKKRVRRTLKPRKALITLSPNAIEHLRALLNQPDPKLIKVGVKNRGCSGLTYHLEYISEPNKFDEIVEQDGVKVVIDSKALFSIVGSEMDWLDDKISSRFIFKNPNSKGTCGCGESFMV